MAEGGSTSAAAPPPTREDLLLPHNAPITFCDTTVTKYGQPPEYKPKLRRVCVRSDGIFLLTVPTTAGGRSVLKRAVPFAKISSIDLRNKDSQFLFRVMNEHDMYLTAEPDAVKDLLRGIDEAMRSSSIQITAKRKSKSEFDLRANDGTMLLTKDLMTYPSIEDKVRVRCALIQRENYPHPPYTLEEWDGTLKKLSQAPDLRANAAALGIPPPLLPFIDGLHVSLAGMVTLISEAPRREKDTSPRRSAPVKCIMIFTPVQVKFVTAEPPVTPEVIAVFNIRKIEYNTPRKMLRLTLQSGVRHEIEPAAEAMGSTFSTDSTAVFARCLAALMERFGYAADLEDAAAGSGAGSSPSGGSPATSTGSPSKGPKSVSFAGPPASSAGTPAAAAPPAADDDDAAVGGDDAPATTSGAAAATKPKPERSKSMVLMAQVNSNTMDEERLKKLVADFRSPYGAVCRRFMSPVTLLARQCYRLTSRWTWEPRVVTITEFGILLCMDNCTVRRTIDYTLIEEMLVTKHWEGDSLTLYLPTDFDCVLRGHESTPKMHRMSDIAAVISLHAPQAKLRQEVSDSKKRLKSVVGRGLTLRKPDDFESPGRKLERLKSASPTNSSMASSPTNGSMTNGSGLDRDAVSNSSFFAPRPQRQQQQPQQPAAAASPAATADQRADDDGAAKPDLSLDLADIRRVQSEVVYDKPPADAAATDENDAASPSATSAASPGNQSMYERDLGAFQDHLHPAAADDGGSSTPQKGTGTAAPTTADDVATPARTTNDGDASREAASTTKSDAAALQRTESAAAPPPSVKDPAAAKANLRERLERFFRHYAPAKGSNIDQIMERWKGDEVGLWNALEERYGAEADIPHVREARQRLRQRLERFFAHYAPAKLGNLDNIVDQWAEDEGELWKTLEGKYGPEKDVPPTTAADDDEQPKEVTAGSAAAVAEEPSSADPPVDPLAETSKPTAADDEKKDDTGVTATRELPATAAASSSPPQEASPAAATETTTSTTAASSAAPAKKPHSDEQLNTRLTRYFQYYAPEKLGQVSTICSQFSDDPGAIQDLFEGLEDNYGPESAIPAGWTYDDAAAAKEEEETPKDETKIEDDSKKATPVVEDTAAASSSHHQAAATDDGDRVEDAMKTTAAVDEESHSSSVVESAAAGASSPPAAGASNESTGGAAPRAAGGDDAAPVVAERTGPSVVEDDRDQQVGDASREAPPAGAAAAAAAAAEAPPPQPTETTTAAAAEPEKVDADAPSTSSAAPIDETAAASDETHTTEETHHTEPAATASAAPSKEDDDEAVRTRYVDPTPPAACAGDSTPATAASAEKAPATTSAPDDSDERVKEATQPETQNAPAASESADAAASSQKKEPAAAPPQKEEQTPVSSATVVDDDEKKTAAAAAPEPDSDHSTKKGSVGSSSPKRAGVPSLALGSLSTPPRGGGGGSDESPRGQQWSPRRLRPAGWSSPRRAASPDASAAEGSPRRLADREGSVLVVDDAQAHAIISGSRRAGVLEDPAAVSPNRTDEDGRDWVGFRTKLGGTQGDTVAFHATRDFLSLIQKFGRRHRREKKDEGDLDRKQVVCVCADGPAVFSFSVSFLLFALSQPEAEIRNGVVLLREPQVGDDSAAAAAAASPADGDSPATRRSGGGGAPDIEWVPVPIDRFCELTRSGEPVADIARGFMREVSQMILLNDDEEDGEEEEEASPSEDE